MNLPKAFVATILFIFIKEVSAAWFLLDYQHDYVVAQSTYYVLITALIETIIVLLFVKYAVGGKVFAIGKVGPIWWGVALLLGIISVLIQLPLSVVYNELFGTNSIIRFSWWFGSIFSWDSMAFILLFPLAEENFFRSYIQRSLLKGYSATVSVTVSAILFSIVHLEFIFLRSTDFSITLYPVYLVFCGGLASALLYNKTRSIWPSIFMHMIWNLTVTIL